MALADDFQGVIDSLPPDWTQLEMDLGSRTRTATSRPPACSCRSTRCRTRSTTGTGACARRTRFGHAAAPETVRGTLALLDGEGIAGELALREARSGRVEVVQMWGRPESVRQEFHRRRAQ